MVAPSVVAFDQGISAVDTVASFVSCVLFLRRMKTVGTAVLVTSADRVDYFLPLCNTFLHERYHRVRGVVVRGGVHWDSTGPFVVRTPPVRHGVVYRAVWSLMMDVMNTHMVCTHDKIYQRIQQLCPEVAHDDPAGVYFDVHTSLMQLDGCGMIKYLSRDKIAFTSLAAFAAVMEHERDVHILQAPLYNRIVTKARELARDP